MRHEDIDEDLNKLVFEFFYRFSRFESALKEQGYLRDRRPLSNAEPDWNAFADKLGADYEPNADACELIEAKPKKQIVMDNCTLGFVDRKPRHGERSIDIVIDHVRTVRNNLFHGGKHGADGWDNPERIKLLLKKTNSVLDDLADRGGFDGDYSGYY